MDRRSFLNAAGALAGIATTGSAARAQPLPGAARARAASQAAARPRWALVLGGGTARGFAHIGVIKVLQQEGLMPDLVVGTSAGALIGAFFAAGYSGVQMEEVAMKVKDGDVADLVTGNKRGMVAGDALQAFVNKYLYNTPIERLKLPFAAVAANLTTGEPAIFRTGDAGFAVRASSSVPAVFIPARQGDNEYVDGGLISPVPIRIARDLGADHVVAVSVSGTPQAGHPVGMYELLMQSFDIMASSLTRLELREADVVIKPELGRIAFTDFDSRNLLITLGEQAARRAVPSIRSKLRLG